MDAPILEDPNDNSYWIPPQSQGADKGSKPEVTETVMCSNCLDVSSTKYFHEKILGKNNGPASLEFWTLGDPRFNDPENPLFAPHLSPKDDWRDVLDVDVYREFFNYARYKYGGPEDKCSECQNLKKKRDKFINVCRATKKKKKKSTQEQEELLKDLKEVREHIHSVEEQENVCSEEKLEHILKDKPRIREALHKVRQQGC